MYVCVSCENYTPKGQCAVIDFPEALHLDADDGVVYSRCAIRNVSWNIRIYMYTFVCVWLGWRLKFHMYVRVYLVSADGKICIQIYIGKIPGEWEKY